MSEPEQTVEALRQLVNERERAIALLSKEVPLLEEQVEREVELERELTAELSYMERRGVGGRILSVLKAKFGHVVEFAFSGWGCAALTLFPFVIGGLSAVYGTRNAGQSMAYRAHHAKGGVLQTATNGPPIGSLCDFHIHRVTAERSGATCLVTLKCDDWTFNEKQPCWVQTTTYSCGEDKADTCYKHAVIAGDKNAQKRPYFRYDEPGKNVTMIDDVGATTVLLYAMEND